MQIVYQLIGLVGTGTFLLSYQFKDNKTLFRLQMLAYVIYTVHFFLIGAATGGFSYILNAVRSYCLSKNGKFTGSGKMCAVLCIAQASVLLFTWAGVISILPVIANIAATIGNYSKNARKIRTVAIFINSPLWMIYNIIVGSWAGILDEVVTEVSAIISIIRFGWKNLGEENSKAEDSEGI